MQNFSRFSATRVLGLLGFLVAAWFVTGCQSLVITNLTPTNVPANPSQIYTITASFKPTMKNVDASSISPRIVIDGQVYPMVRSTAADIWEFEYQVPAGRVGANYYFIVEYRHKDATESQDAYSELQTILIASRYVLRPEANRAPVGSRVSVLGAGFTPTDVVYFNLTPTRTVFESPSSISFFVPDVATGESYQLRVTGGGDTLQAGTFRVDSISFTVAPSSLTLRTGEQQALTFNLPQPAPAGGMLIDVTTDVAESIIMPEVIVPAGQTSVTIAIQGGKPGSGSLFFRSSAGESSIPVTVSP